MYPLCQDVHVGVQFPSIQLSSCEKFKDMSPKDKAAALEEQGRCSLCTSFTHRRDKCYQKKRRYVITTCCEPEGNTVCCREHHPMLHLSRKGGLSPEIRDDSFAQDKKQILPYYVIPKT